MLQKTFKYTVQVKEDFESLICKPQWDPIVLNEYTVALVTALPFPPLLPLLSCSALLEQLHVT